MWVDRYGLCDPTISSAQLGQVVLRRMESASQAAVSEPRMYSYPSQERSNHRRTETIVVWGEAYTRWAHIKHTETVSSFANFANVRCHWDSNTFITGHCAYLQRTRLPTRRINCFITYAYFPYTTFKIQISPAPHGTKMHPFMHNQLYLGIIRKPFCW